MVAPRKQYLAADRVLLQCLVDKQVSVSFKWAELAIAISFEVFALPTRIS